MDEALTQKEAAKRLGISTWKLRKLSNAGDVPRLEDKSYPWPEVREAFDEISGEDRNPPPDDSSGSEASGDQDEEEREDLTQKDAAARLGISTWKLRQLSNAGDVPRAEDKSYPWPAVKRAYEELQEEDQEGAGDEEPEEERPGEPEEESEEASPQDEITQKELAKRLALTERRIRDMEDMPRLENGKYPWPKALHWYIELKQLEALRQKGYDEDGDGTLTEQRRRKTAAEARLKELKLAERRKELIARSDVLDLVQAPLRAVDQTLKEAPIALASDWAEHLDVSEAEAMDLIEDLVEEVRAELRSVFEEEESSVAA